jgi:hypothetical protein
MVGKSPRLLLAKAITILVPVLGLIVFFLLQGRQGDAVNVSLIANRNARYVYVSLGEYGAFQVYEVHRERPVPVTEPQRVPNSRLRKYAVHWPGLKKSSTILTERTAEIVLPDTDITRVVEHGDYLYALDPNTGIIILDNADRKAPQKIATVPFYGVKDIAFIENEASGKTVDIAFVAAGAAGAYLLDLRNPETARVIGHADTPGSAERVYPGIYEVQGEGSQNTPTSNSGESQLRSIYILYVANGPNGFSILDFRDASMEPREIATLATFTTNESVNDLHITRDKLFVANGLGGVYVYDFFASQNDPRKPLFLGLFNTSGDARQVIYRSGVVYVADGQAGLVILRYTPLSDGGITLTELKRLELPGGAHSFQIIDDLAVVSSGVRGVYFLDISEPENAFIKKNFQTPGLPPTSDIIAALGDSSLRGAKVWNSVKDIIKEIAVTGVLIVIFGFILLPFTQPVKSFNDFINAFRHFVSYLFQGAGRAVFIVNGRLVSRLHAMDVQHLRLIILDNASAGLVLDGKSRMRVLGPGSDQLEPQDALVKIVDLRPRHFIVGPADENPFEPKQPAEDEKMWRERLIRRAQTSAFTRDDVEIVPNIIVEFAVKAQTQGRQPPYGFQSAYALQALEKEYAASKTPVDSISGGDLDRLPGDLAAQAWRYYLPFFTLEGLFSPLQFQDQVLNNRVTYGLDQIRGYIFKHLTQQYVDEIGEDGLPNGQQHISEAFNELEQSGLSVQKVWVTNLQIEPDRAAAFLSRWQSNLPDNLKQQSEALEARYQEKRGINTQLGLVDFLKAVLQPLHQGMQHYQELPVQFLHLNRSLHLLVLGTRSLGGIGPAERLKLDEILAWLEGNLEA